MKNLCLLTLTSILPLSLVANTPEPTSALEYQQTTNTRIVVEENFLRFFTGGSERMTIDVDGNVGIGTATPSSEIEIKSVAGNDSELHINTTSDGGHSVIRFEDAGVDTWGLISNYPQLGKFSLYNYNNNTNAVVVNQSGNVGIGTSDPGSYKLSVAGSLFALGALDIMGSRPADSSLEGLYQYGSYNTSFQFATSSWGASHAILFDAYKSASSVNGGLSTTGNTKHMHGVGGYSGGAGSIHYNGNGGTMYFFISQQSPGAGTNVVWGTPKMMLQRDGTVGINTNDPDENYKLHVAGGIRATNYKSDVNSYADFVFEDDYDLPTLTEVEQYIEENNHLPDIPSESEARANGVDLQEMQAKLLQKIEELTLYVIELKKENESLQKRTQTLETQVNK